VRNYLPWVEYKFDNGLDCLAFELDTGVDWYLMVVQPLLQLGKDLLSIHVDGLATGSVEICPHVLQVAT
jgi:hypothetical protein